jgi:hypothetical protein
MIPRMRTHRPAARLLLLAFSVSGLRTSQAQSSSAAPAPTAVADSFFHATEQARWRDAARLMDLDTFGALRDQAVQNAREARKLVHPITPEQLMKYDPKLPRVVAEYQASQSNEQRGRTDWLHHEYADVPTIDSLAALPVEDAAARWLEAKDMRYHLKQELREQQRRCNLPDSVLTRMWPAVATHHILGTVVVDSLAYVLYDEVIPFRDDTSSTPPRRRAVRQGNTASYTMAPPVMTLRQIQGTWRVAPSYPFDETSFMIIDCAKMNSTKSPRK